MFEGLIKHKTSKSVDGLMEYYNSLTEPKQKLKSRNTNSTNGKIKTLNVYLFQANMVNISFRRFFFQHRIVCGKY